MSRLRLQRRTCPRMHCLPLHKNGLVVLLQHHAVGRNTLQSVSFLEKNFLKLALAT